ncbi:hypothetical protein [Microcystis phage MJing1]|nr:hypothetical protein [Microcystis phage MJing1]
MTQSPAVCLTCRFAHQPVPPVGPIECRCGPPTQSVVEVSPYSHDIPGGPFAHPTTYKTRAVWPVVSSGDWCFSHQPKDPST